MAIFQSLKNSFQRPKFPGKSLNFCRKSDFLQISRPKLKIQSPKKMQLHTPTAIPYPHSTPSYLVFSLIKKKPYFKGGLRQGVLVAPRWDTKSGLRRPRVVAGTAATPAPGAAATATGAPSREPAGKSAAEAPCDCFSQDSLISSQGNRKWWRQTGSRQSTPLSTIRTRYGNSVSTPEATRTCKTQ